MKLHEETTARHSIRYMMISTIQYARYGISSKGRRTNHDEIISLSHITLP